MAAALVGCTAAGAAAPVGQPRPDVADSPTAAIAASLDGVHLDVLGGGDPSPGRTTTRVAHSGHTAVEDYWTTDGWCRSRTYDWQVTDVIDPQHFTIRYEVTWEDTSCMSHWGDEIGLVVTDVSSVDGHTVIEGRYDSVWDEPTVRTVCAQEAAACDV